MKKNSKSALMGWNPQKSNFVQKLFALFVLLSFFLQQCLLSPSLYADNPLTPTTATELGNNVPVVPFNPAAPVSPTHSNNPVIPPQSLAAPSPLSMPQPQPSGSGILPSSLPVVASFSMDGVFTDASGSNLSVTPVNNPTFVAGKMGQAVNFNGTDQHLQIADDPVLDLTNGMTLSAWVNPTDLSGWRTVFLKEASTGLSYALYASGDTNEPFVCVNLGMARHCLNGGTSLTANTWTHLAGTYDGTTLRLYVNGVQAASVDITGSILQTPGDLSLGGNTVWGEYFEGALDQVKVYNVALSASEIRQEMNNHPPVVPVQLPVTVNEDGQVIITITGATDPDGDPLQIQFVGAPNYGDASQDPNDPLQMIYTPFVDFFGQDTIYFRMTDGKDFSADASVVVNVLPVNDPPVLGAEPVTNLNISTGQTANITVDVTDPDGDSLTFSAAGLPRGATFDPNTHVFLWTPTANQGGVYTVTFSITDGIVTVQQIVIITATGNNNGPVISAIADPTVPENQALNITVTATDVDGDPLTYTATGLARGAAFDPATHTFGWTPDFTQAGSYAVTFYVTDGFVTASTTVNITVTSVNRPPAFAATADPTVPENQLLNFTLTAADADGDPLSFSATNLPTGATFDPVTHAFNWTPDFAQAGTYTPVFSVTDGAAPVYLSMMITVTGVNRPPTIVPIADQTVRENQSLSFPLTATDADGDPLIYVVTGLPSGATFDFHTHVFSWTPDFDQAGIYSTTFRVTDGTDTANLPLTITVTGTNRDPIMIAPGDQTLDENQTVNFTVSATDADGDPLSFSAAGLPTGATFNPATQAFNWTPDYTQSGTYVARFNVTDGTVNVNIPVQLTVNNVNRPPSTQTMTVVTDEDLQKAVTLTANDADSDSLTFTIVNQTGHGSLNCNGTRCTYIPAANFNGSDSFSYRANDGSVDSNVTAVNITVNPVNDPPVADPQFLNMNANGILPVVFTGTDVDGDPLQAVIVNGPVNGTFDPVAGVYTPNRNYVGTEALVFQMTDGRLSSANETVMIQVAPGNAPVADSQTLNGNEDGTMNLTLTASDHSGNPLTYRVVIPPAHGALSGTGANPTYTPNADFNGTDSFTFKVNNRLLDSGLATVSITVNPVNDAPVMTQIPNQRADEGQSFVLAATAADVDGDPLSLGLSVQGTPALPQGLTIDSQTGLINWQLGFNQAGSYTLAVTVTDGVLTDTESFQMDVRNVNHAPVITPLGPQQVNENQPLAFTVGVSDTDGDPVTLSVSNIPAGAGFDDQTGAFSWTPDFTRAGTYSVTFRASDSGLSASEVITITVNNVNRAPAANAVATVVLDEDTTQAVVLSGSDLDGDTPTFSNPSVVNGALSGTGPILVYTPPANFTGTELLTVTADDEKGNQVTVTIPIEVSAPQPAPASPAGNGQVPFDPRLSNGPGIGSGSVPLPDWRGQLGRALGSLLGKGAGGPGSSTGPLTGAEGTERTLHPKEGVTQDVMVLGVEEMGKTLGQREMDLRLFTTGPGDGSTLYKGVRRLYKGKMDYAPLEAKKVVKNKKKKNRNTTNVIMEHLKNPTEPQAADQAIVAVQETTTNTDTYANPAPSESRSSSASSPSGKGFSNPEAK